MAPYRSILRYYRCDTPYRAILFKGGQQSPKMVRCPPLVRSFAILSFATYRAIITATPHKTIRRFQRGFLRRGENIILNFGVARALVAIINFAPNPCANLRIYIGFNKEPPNEKPKINDASGAPHHPNYWDFPPLAKTPLEKPPKQARKALRDYRYKCARYDKYRSWASKPCPRFDPAQHISMVPACLW